MEGLIMIMSRQAADGVVPRMGSYIYLAIVLSLNPKNMKSTEAAQGCSQRIILPVNILSMHDSYSPCYRKLASFR